MNMVEKVARAMMVAKNGGDYWDEMSDDSDVDYVGRTEALKMARAAIKAMGEPSNDMLEAMWNAMFEGDFDGTQLPMCGAGFEAAIDAALDERS